MFTMDAISNLNVSILCRCCLSKQNLCNIYNVRNKKHAIPYTDMIRECFAVNVCETDGLPPWLCAKCTNKLNSFYRFRIKCMKTFDSLAKEAKDKKQKHIIKIEEIEEVNEDNDGATTAEIFEDLSCNDHVTDKFMLQERVEYSEENVECSKENIECSKENVEYLEENVECSKGNVECSKENIECSEENFEYSNENIEYSEENVEYLEDYEIHVENECELKNFVINVQDVGKNEDKQDNNKNIMEEIEQNNVEFVEETIKAENDSVMKELKIVLSQISERQTVCPLCNKLCSKNKMLLDHVKYAHFGIKYYCEICKKDFKGEYRHMLTHRQKDWKTCNECGDTFTHKSLYISHLMQIHGRNGLYQCECGESFASKTEFKQHSFLEHNAKSYMCQFCDASYTRKAKLLDHVQRHTQGKVMRHRVRNKKVSQIMSINDIPIISEKERICPLCQYVFSTHNRLLDHVRSYHLGEKYFCEICKKYYQSEYRHNKLRHTRAKWMDCEQCSMKFKLKKGYEQHMWEVHGYVDITPWRYICHCNEGFQNLQIYRKHKYQAHGETEFVCHYCSKGYFRKYKLEQHMLMHTREKVFPCKVCHKKFYCLDNLYKHNKSHRQSENYICDHCGKAFRLKLYLRAHITRHDPLWKHHACAVCGKRFRRSDHRNNHQRLVHKQDNITTHVSM